MHPFSSSSATGSTASNAATPKAASTNEASTNEASNAAAVVGTALTTCAEPSSAPQPAVTEGEAPVARKGKAKARPKAAPYKEGKGWAMRSRYKNHDIYVSGKKTEGAARKAVETEQTTIDRRGAPKGRGPNQTTAAQAMQDYAMKRLPFKKGAVQEAVRLNHYLRAAHLATLVVTPHVATVPMAPPRRATKPGKSDNQKKTHTYFDVTLEPAGAERRVANGLHAHRNAQMTKTANARKHRAVLSTKTMGSITRDDMQEYMDALRREGAAPATMQLERSLWRVLFNHAHSKWGWVSLFDNPATDLVMPQVDNERKRVMSMEEQGLMDAALATCRNAMVPPLVALLRETSMRSSEPLHRAFWVDVDWERKILNLQDSKSRKREVPLSPLALQALRDLEPGEGHEPLLKISYEALKAAWQRACERAGVTDLILHDLRRTAATRLALKTGSRYLVKALLGNKTDIMVDRYVQVGASDVVAVLHAPEQPEPTLEQCEAVNPQAPPAPLQSALAPAGETIQKSYTLDDMNAIARQAADAAIANYIEMERRHDATQSSAKEASNDVLLPGVAAENVLPFQQKAA